jgi:hypothetical protein
MLYFVCSLHDTCYMRVVNSDAARSVIVRYDYHYYCCDNRQYRKIAVINQVKEEGVGIKCVS